MVAAKADAKEAYISVPEIPVRPKISTTPHFEVLPRWS